MVNLVLGANTALMSDVANVRVDSLLAFGQTVGMVWLALDDNRCAKVSPAYLHEQKDWAKYDNHTWTLDLP